MGSLGGQRIAKGQATDIAPATAEAGIVYVVGVKPINPVPQEMNWLAEQPIFEDRYKNNFFTFFSPQNDANKQQLKFTIIPSDKWMRIRTACVKVTWQFSAPTNTQKDWTATPLPGFGITAWDQINVLLGSNGTAISNPTMNNPHLQMLHFMGNVKKNSLVLNEWYKMAGFYDFKTYDYAGPIVNSRATANTQPFWIEPTTLDANGAVLADIPRPFGDNTVAMSMDNLRATSKFAYGLTTGAPAVSTSFPAFLPGTADRSKYMFPYNNRGGEGGLWYDPAMREFRQTFYGNKACLKTNTLTKCSLFCSAMESILLWPPMQLELQFFYNLSQNARPRVLITPGCRVNGTGAQGNPAPAQAGEAFNIDLGVDSVENVTMDFVKDESYFLMQFVEMRSDIHQAFLFSWAQNSGSFVQPVTWYDLYVNEGIVNKNQIQLDLIGQQGMIPYKTCFATTLRFPLDNTVIRAGNTFPDDNKFYCEFAYGDCNLEEMVIDTTMPTSRTHFRKFWDRFTSGTDPQAISELTLRGVRSHEYWMQEKINRNQGFAVAVLEDCDSLDFSDVYHYQMSMPHGAAGIMRSAGVNAPNATVYGSHSVLCRDDAVPLNSGLHNYVNTFLWTPIGIDMQGLNYGVYRGNQRLTAKFNPTPKAPINLYCLNSYQICLQLGGNGVAQKNLAI